jgi:ABC-type protease/lipase transport system fused ATPase/permease subunit
MALPPPSGKLDVQNLTIEAGDSRTILSDLSFSLEPGEVMGVIGPTASGKTSLTRALVGLWPPTSGHVRLDGADVAPWIRADLGQHIGYAPVEIDLFEGTVAENIARLGVVDSEQVVAAAQAVGIHDTILSFPKGYDTRIGEVGHVLTGGQRQRIVIARAIYGDPPYVVMDEPNASLDEEGEQALVRLLRHLKQKKTTVVFTTHRIMLLAGADKLMVLRNGKIRMYGPTASVVQELKQKSEERATARQVVPAARVATGGAS